MVAAYFSLSRLLDFCKWLFIDSPAVTVAAAAAATVAAAVLGAFGVSTGTLASIGVDLASSLRSLLDSIGVVFCAVSLDRCDGCVLMVAVVSLLALTVGESTDTLAAVAASTLDVFCETGGHAQAVNCFSAV